MCDFLRGALGEAGADSDRGQSPAVCPALAMESPLTVSVSGEVTECRGRERLPGGKSREATECHGAVSMNLWMSWSFRRSGLEGVAVSLASPAAAPPPFLAA